MSVIRTQILHDQREGAGGAAIRRMNVEIEIDGQRELVALVEDEAGPRAITTSGEVEGPFVEAALAVFEAGRTRLAALGPREMRTLEDPARLNEELAESIESLVLAIARAGLNAGRVSPTVSHAFATLEERISGLDALGIERFIGRLRNAIEFEDLTESAMLLHGALRFVDDLKRGGEAPAERIGGWIAGRTIGGAAPIVLNERSFVELGREWVAGLERAGIGRRYLMDLESGEIVREEFRAGKGEASLGGSFRELCAGLARLSSGSAPRRIRFDQYELWHQPREESMVRLDELAERSARRLLTRFVAEHHRAPGQAEPFALFAPAGLVSRESAHALLDDDGEALPLSSAEGLELDTALAVACEEGRELRWISGRLFHAEGALVLRPFMVSFRDGETARLR